MTTLISSINVARSWAHHHWSSKPSVSAFELLSAILCVLCDLCVCPSWKTRRALSTQSTAELAVELDGPEGRPEGASYDRIFNYRSFLSDFGFVTRQ